MPSSDTPAARRQIEEAKAVVIQFVDVDPEFQKYLEKKPLSELSDDELLVRIIKSGKFQFDKVLPQDRLAVQNLLINLERKILQEQEDVKNSQDQGTFLKKKKLFITRKQVQALRKVYLSVFGFDIVTGKTIANFQKSVSDYTRYLVAMLGVYY